MSKKVEEIINLLNKALETEHQANIQYLSHAEVVDGINSEPIIERLKEIAEDEKKHAAMLRTLIGDYLDGVPAITMAKAKNATTIEDIIKTNLKDEKEAVELYTQILEKVREAKQELPYNFLKIEHDLRHIIMDEQEHIAELRKLLGMKLSEIEKIK
ncbi:MAG: ferritin-like domain-containing protein [Candidatus Diapherotrites archaeon]|nr:ferritin-like domain-containing protein [Candidatus Diapherotrites archaeon]